MPKRSAGLIMFRRKTNVIEVLLAHPGGPFWIKKDLGAWSIPKGELGDAEDPLTAAKREFTEELGLTPQGEFMPLGEVRQPGGKIVAAWAFEGDCDPSKVRSNTFSMEWPPHSGKMEQFPEIDRAEWFSLETARSKLLKGQLSLLDRLESAAIRLHHI